MQLENLLQDYGLTEKEARIYLAGLELGVVPASIIAKKIGENRITVYSALQMLCKKEMSSEHTKNGKKFYMMLDPKDFHNKMKQKCNKLETAVPELLALTSVGGANKPKVFYYEGFDGVKKIYEDTLEQSDKEMLTLSSTADMSEEIYKYLFDVYRVERTKKKIHIKLICFSEDKGLQSLLMSNKEEYREILKLNNSNFSLSDEIIVYGDDKVAMIMFSEEESSGVIIHSKSLNNTFKQIFNFLWDQNKKQVGS